MEAGTGTRCGAARERDENAGASDRPRRALRRWSSTSRSRSSDACRTAIRSAHGSGPDDATWVTRELPPSIRGGMALMLLAGRVRIAGCSRPVCTMARWLSCDGRRWPSPLPRCSASQDVACRASCRPGLEAQEWPLRVRPGMAFHESDGMRWMAAAVGRGLPRCDSTAVHRGFVRRRRHVARPRRSSCCAAQPCVASCAR